MGGVWKWPGLGSESDNEKEEGDIQQGNRIVRMPGIRTGVKTTLHEILFFLRMTPILGLNTVRGTGCGWQMFYGLFSHQYQAEY